MLRHDKTNKMSGQSLYNTVELDSLINEQCFKRAVLLKGGEGGRGAHNRKKILENSFMGAKKWLCHIQNHVILSSHIKSDQSLRCLHEESFGP